jgi:hypothetical protein
VLLCTQFFLGFLAAVGCPLTNFGGSLFGKSYFQIKKHADIGNLADNFFR